LLRRAAAPATFFVGPPLEGGDAFWWEDLQSLAERGPPSRLASLPAFDLSRLADGAEWAIHSLAGVIQNLEPDRRDEVAAELRDLAEDNTRRRLDSAGIASLVADGFEVAFHTPRHYALPTLDDDRLARELSDGRDILEDIVGRPVTMIAYPHGTADARVARAARTAGYELGFTTRQARVDVRTNPLLVPRTEVQSAPLAAFQRRIVHALAAGDG
jgi:peptidoglycan/xylan/chitin deacetylase (PgdA/CDA1 family)